MVIINLKGGSIHKPCGYVSSMKQEYISYWQNTLQNSQRLEFYRSFKTDHTSYSYLDLKRGTAGRMALVKLRISNHKLMIEIGRYNQTTKDNRHCPFCGCIVIEDDFHFLFHLVCIFCVFWQNDNKNNNN